MTTPALLAIAALAIVVTIYQGYVTARVLRSRSATGVQKALQTALVWVLPALGAALVHAFLISDTEIPAKRDEQFIPNPGNDGAG